MSVPLPAPSLPCEAHATPGDPQSVFLSDFSTEEGIESPLSGEIATPSSVEGEGEMEGEGEGEEVDSEEGKRRATG